jgi:UrcA family protein
MVLCIALSVHAVATAVSLSLSVSFVSAGACAAERPGASVRLTVGDLDFSKAPGVTLFPRRIDQAARPCADPTISWTSWSGAPSIAISAVRCSVH